MQETTSHWSNGATQASIFNETVYKANQANKWLFLEEIQNPSKLVGSPSVVVGATLAYIAFVCLIGPLLMSFREAFQLKTVIRLYNLTEVLLAGYLCFSLHRALGGFANFFRCDRVFSFADGSSNLIYQMAGFILAVRLSEYLDTVFFTLRKKQNQVTFLHVFHHAFVPIYAYWILRTGPLRFNVFIIYINSAIHVVMYFYYFLATFQQAPREQGDDTKIGQTERFPMSLVRHLLRFKKYITQMQIVQFVLLATYSIYIYLQPKQCSVPNTYIASNLLLAGTFLGLFVHFYIKSYKAAKAAVRSKQA